MGNTVYSEEASGEGPRGLREGVFNSESHGAQPGKGDELHLRTIKTVFGGPRPQHRDLGLLGCEL